MITSDVSAANWRRVKARRTDSYPLVYRYARRRSAQGINAANTRTRFSMDRHHFQLPFLHVKLFSHGSR